MPFSKAFPQEFSLENKILRLAILAIVAVTLAGCMAYEGVSRSQDDSDAGYKSSSSIGIQMQPSASGQLQPSMGVSN